MQPAHRELKGVCSCAAFVVDGTDQAVISWRAAFTRSVSSSLGLSRAPIRALTSATTTPSALMDSMSESSFSAAHGAREPNR